MNREKKRERALLLTLLVCFALITAIGTTTALVTERNQRRKSEQAENLEGASFVKEENGDKAQLETEEMPEESGEESLQPVTDSAQTAGDVTDPDAAQTAGNGAQQILEQKLANYHFGIDTEVFWPIEGRVIKEYDMEHTVYFPTTHLYRCNPGLFVQGEAGMEVQALQAGIVTAVEQDDWYGNTVTMELGDGYEITYGQLDSVYVRVGDEVTTRQIIGTLAEPTYYFKTEGCHLYMAMRKDGDCVNPMDYLAYDNE